MGFSVHVSAAALGNEFFNKRSRNKILHSVNGSFVVTGASKINKQWLWIVNNMSLKLLSHVFRNWISYFHLFLSCFLLTFWRASDGIVLWIPWFQHSQKAADGENRPTMPMEDALVQSVAQGFPVVYNLDLGRDWRLMGNWSIPGWNWERTLIKFHSER